MTGDKLKAMAERGTPKVRSDRGTPEGNIALDE